MFNQFKSALESVAQQPIRILDVASSPEPNGDNASRSSLDVQGATTTTRSASLSSSQLAESALSSIRNSLAPQRVNSPAPDTVKTPPTVPGTRKSTLEERLRRAAQASATSDMASVAAGSSSSSTRGRSDSVASQTRPTLSRVASSSPATRARPVDASSSAVASSRTRPVGSSGLGSKPPSRSSSPAPASRPPSRAASPAPVARNSSTAQRTASKPPSRPPSRSNSPTPVARTRRASDLAQCARADSPSRLPKHQSPLRRSSIAARNVPLPGSSIATTSSTGSDDSQAGVLNTEEEEVSLVSNDIEEENEKRDPDSSTSEPTEPVVQLGRDGQEQESLTQTQPSPATSKSSPDNSTDIVVNLAVVEVAADLEPSNITPIPLQAETTDGEPLDRHESDDIREANISSVPEEVQSTDNENVPDSSLALVTQHEKLPEADLPPLDSGPSGPSPESASTVSESPNLSTNHQERERPNGVLDIDHSAEVESLRARLKEVEQRFSDVSVSFKRLQAEKLAADAILKENSPLESFGNPDSLRDYFTNLRIKDEVFQEDLKHLTGKLESQNDRLQELHETHKLETQALSEELRKTKTHLAETETLFEAAQRATTNVEEMADQQKQEITRLVKDLEHSKNLAKEEEEKRVKAITLLKTVRQKLVKAEKDREDVVKEMGTIKERERGDKEKEQAEKFKLLRQLEVSQSTHAQEIASLRAQFEKDLAATRERYEQEVTALTGQHEQVLANIKISYNKDLASKSSQISSLENSLNKVTRDKNAFFDQLQLRQAELESAQAHVDTIQHQNTELEFELREANDRLALVREEYAELQRESETRSREPSVSAEEIARVVSVTEVKYEARLAEMKRNISVLEKERHESEVDWSRKLKEKVRELEELKGMLGSATRMRESEESTVANLKSELESAQETNKGLQREVAELTLLKGQIEESERSLKDQEHETNVRIRVLEKQIDEHKAREAQLKQGNKTLREELRKVQSSAALLERQRNPGVGYWGTRTSGSGDAALNESRVSTPADTPSRSSSPTPSSASTKADEEVNLEYVRNVVLQFLEHKERRSQLVKVLSIILHFTPQETRRLIAKV